MGRIARLLPKIPKNRVSVLSTTLYGIGRKEKSLAEQVREILTKYSGTMLIPGPDGILVESFQPRNYRESTGQTLAGVDQQVGLVIDAAQSQSPNQLPGGSFNNAADWSIAAGWQVANGELAHLSAGTNIITTPFVTGVGKAYLCKFDIVSQTVVGNGVSLRIGSTNLTPRTGVGTYSEIFTQTVAGSIVAVVARGATGDWLGVIDNVEIYELPGIHAQQATSGYQPYLRQSGGVNSWQFDGTDDRFALSTVLSGSLDFCDLHAVTLQPKASASTFADCRNNAGTGTHVGRLRLSNTGILVVAHMNDAGATVGANGPNIGNTPAVIGSVRQGTSHTVFVDNAAVLSTTLSGVYTCTHSTLGARGSGTSENMQGYLYGSILLPSNPTEEERTLLIKFLAKLQGRTL